MAQLSPSVKRVAEIMNAFGRKKVAVVGDFVADIYLEATPTRLSREAPVMIVTYQGEKFIPGGAANAVHNLLALGAEVVPVGVIGDDAEGRQLARFFHDHCENVSGVVVQKDFGTVSKTRIMVGGEYRMHQQVLRIDREPSRKLAEETHRLMIDRLTAILPEVDGVLFSDYGYGLLDREVVAASLAAARGKVTAADSRYSLYDFAGVDVVTPNHAEAAELVVHDVASDEQSEAAGRELYRKLGTKAVIITRGNRGMMLLEGTRAPEFIPAATFLGEVTDVSGAGDTVISVLVLALCAGANYHEAALLANLGAGVVVTKPGAATCSPEELLRAATMAAGESAHG
jgi:rfaE bifunctional protein kinase chain/domain